MRLQKAVIILFSIGVQGILQLIVQTEAKTRQMQFVKTVSVRGYQELAMAELTCASMCLDSYPDCRSFVYNVTMETCYVAASPLVLRFSEFGTNANLYSACDLGRGYKMHLLADNTSVCLSEPQEPKSFTEAVDLCIQLGGYVASAKTLEKYDLLDTLIPSMAAGECDDDHDVETIWVGLYDEWGEGGFEWLDDGSDLTNLQVKELFESGQIDIYKSCVFLRKNVQGLKTERCVKQFGYLCEMMIN